MSSQHTPGRINVNGTRLYADDLPGIDCIATMQVSNQPMWDQDARRLVACWNACEGIETHALELMTGDHAIKEQITATGKQKPRQTRKTIEYRRQRDELLEALKRLATYLDETASCNSDKAMAATARAAIAKATGGAA